MERTAARTTIAQAVVDAQTKAGLSQRALADATGIPLVTLNRSLKGHRDFTVTELACVSIAVGVRLSELVRTTEAVAS